MIKRIINPPEKRWEKINTRPNYSSHDVENTVIEIFESVRKSGDKALIKYAEKYEGVKLKKIIVKQEKIDNSKNFIPKSLKDSIKIAKKNIEKFHISQRSKSDHIIIEKGIECWQEKRPIEKVGLYIPGGSAPLFSTILMLAIPAKIAGCDEIIICTPPNSKGEIPSVILYTCYLCGISKIYKVGGAQAIAAMTFGTESIPGVYKIFGPGNQYVTSAKQYATKFKVSIDLPAGPSELLIYADETAISKYVASDFLSQTEHGPDSQVILVTTNEKIIDPIIKEIKRQISYLNKKEFIRKSIQNSKIIYFDLKERAVKYINDYAPEHYIICSKEEEYFIQNLKNAGSVFIGNYSCESLGDYASGTNHTLPTNGCAKQYSGVNLNSFLKQISFQKITAQGIQKIGPAVEIMSIAEGLDAHQNSVTIRLKDLKK
tara:strand:+ start:8479 stop:9768 length:1290 start_codon:yes stop_codon:yes gene_type:complete